MLTKQSKIALIATIDSKSSNINETISTLKFASRCQDISLSPIAFISEAESLDSVKTIDCEKEKKALTKEINELKNQLEEKSKEFNRKKNENDEVFKYLILLIEKLTNNCIELVNKINEKLENFVAPSIEEMENLMESYADSKINDYFCTNFKDENQLTDYPKYLPHIQKMSAQLVSTIKFLGLKGIQFAKSLNYIKLNLKNNINYEKGFSVLLDQLIRAKLLEKDECKENETLIEKQINQYVNLNLIPLIQEKIPSNIINIKLAKAIENSNNILTKVNIPNMKFVINVKNARTIFSSPPLTINFKELRISPIPPSFTDMNYRTDYMSDIQTSSLHSSIFNENSIENKGKSLKRTKSSHFNNDIPLQHENLVLNILKIPNIYINDFFSNIVISLTKDLIFHQPKECINRSLSVDYSKNTYCLGKKVFFNHEEVEANHFESNLWEKNCLLRNT